VTARSFAREATAHLAATQHAIEQLRDEIDHIGRWGRRLELAFANGGRLLAAGSGASAASAQLLANELVGHQAERPPLSALALNADASEPTMLTSSSGADEVFARQVRAHGQPGDVLVLLSTSGRHLNLLAAADAGRALGMHVWALTGPRPNPLAEVVHDVVAVRAATTATVQEVHQLAVHLLCGAVEDAIADHDLRIPAQAAATSILGSDIAT
jgi:D-sedoheptulose 7-phosphate isomerase